MLSTINLRMCHLRILLTQLQGLMMYDFIISKFLFFLFKLVLFALLIHIFCIRFMHLLLMLVV